MAEDQENKTERVQLLMAPSEVEAIDDWGFKNRIRTRAEAIRRLCQIGMAVDEHTADLGHQALMVRRKIDERMASFIGEHEDAADGLANMMLDIGDDLLKRLVQLDAMLKAAKSSKEIGDAIDAVKDHDDWVKRHRQLTKELGKRVE